MRPEQLLVMDVSDTYVSGLLYGVGRRTLTPLVSHHCEVNSNTSSLEGAEQVIQNCGAGGCRCYLALPASFFYFRNLTLPFTDPAKIDQVLDYELQDSLSFGDQQFVHDATVVETTSRHTHLLAAAIKTAECAPWLELIKGHGMTLEILTISPLSRLLQINDSGADGIASYIYLDAGRSESTFFLMRHGATRAIRTLPGKADGSEGDLVNEFERTFRILAASEPTPEGVPLMIGGVAAEMIPSDRFKSMFQEADIKVIDSTQLSISRDPALQMLPLHLVSRLQGLAAMRARDKRLLNLQKPESARIEVAAGLKKFAPVLLVLLVAVILLSGWQIYEYRTLTLERERLIDEAKEIYSKTMDGKEPVTDPVLDLKSRINEIDQSMIASIVENPDIKVETLLSDISTRLPPSIRVSFERFSFDREKVRIDGTTLSYNDVDRIKKSLELSPFYSVVSIDSAGNRNDSSGVRFSMTLYL